MNITIEAEKWTGNPGIAILGVPFDNVTTREAVAAVERMVHSGRPHYLVTANVDFLVQARKDVELRRILFDADMVLCDGTPLVWVSHLLGNPLPERVAGSDLAPLLIQIAAEKNQRLFFLGGTPESIEMALANLKTEYPGLQATGYSPPFDQLLEMDHEEIKRRITEAGPDMLFVSFGCPKQEKWIAMHYQSLGVPVAIGVGGTIDFLAGQLKRAPMWMQRSGTEWIFRMAQEPRRLFRRYMRDLWTFGWGITGQWWELCCDGMNEIEAKPVASDCAEDWRWIKAPDRFDFAAVRGDLLPAHQCVSDGRHCFLAMDRVEFIDSTGVGLLTRWQKRIHAAGGQLVLVSPSNTVERALSLMGLEKFFATAPDITAARTLAEAWKAERNGMASCYSHLGPGKLMWRGEVTASNANSVWELTERCIASAARASHEVTIDLAKVSFIDSTGLGMMMRARKVAKRCGVASSFANAQPAVRNVIQLARLEGVLLGGTR